MQSIEPTVPMHYWDQTSDESIRDGIPDLLMDAEVVMDDSGVKQPNPLINYTFQKAITKEDSEGWEEQGYYQKDKGYVTQRYPFSGIQYPKAAGIRAAEHNAKMHKDYPTYVEKNKVLNDNVLNALVSSEPYIQQLYEECIQAPTYNLFSNTESAGVTNEHIALEDPHNQIHLAVGGFDLDGIQSV